MSRGKDYQRLLNDRRWKALRAWKLQQNPLCELCAKEGKWVAAVDVHHIREVESAKTPDEMEQLTYDPSNLQALCIPCHVRVHKERGKSTRENHQQRQAEALERWKVRHQPKPKC